MKLRTPRSSKKAFSLVEVVLAIGVLSLAIVALLGLFGPTISSVKQVIDTNQATAVVSRVNTEIQRNMDWDEVVAAVPSTGSVYFVWKSQPTLGEAVEMKFGSSSELGTDFDAGYMVGTPMAVTFERSTVNNYSYDDTASEGYVPVFISIYPIEPSLASTYTAPDSLKGTIEPIFTYTTAKTRSL